MDKIHLYERKFALVSVNNQLQKLAQAISREFFHKQKLKVFIRKNFDIFNIFSQNIDCGIMLEPPR